MSELFGRRWRVTVGTIASSDVAVRFKVTKTLSESANTAEIDVYNLSRDHRREIRSARRPPVRLEVGYRDIPPWIIFQGDSRRVDVLHDSQDWITKVTAGDGEHALRTARATRSFATDTRLDTVVRYFAEAIGVGAGNVSETLQGRGLDQLGDVFPSGFVASGRASMHLTTLLRSAGLTWSIQDGVLQVIPRGGALSRQAVRLASGSGLVGSPTVGKDRTVNAKALLQPDLVPGQRVQLESDVIDGLYRIEKAEYSGETRGNDWYADLVLREQTT